jgi:hypothetical protein
MLVDVLAAFIRKDGRQAGRIMIDDSNNRLKATNTGETALEEELHMIRLEALTIKTCGVMMEHLRRTFLIFCDALPHTTSC